MTGNVNSGPARSILPACKAESCPNSIMVYFDCMSLSSNQYLCIALLPMLLTVVLSMLWLLAVEL